MTLIVLNPKVNTPLFATNANPLQLYYSPRAKILAFNWNQVSLNNIKLKLKLQMMHLERVRSNQSENPCKNNPAQSR